MKIQKPLPGMTPEETERQLHYMNAVIMFKQMHPLGSKNSHFAPSPTENQAKCTPYRFLYQN